MSIRYPRRFKLRNVPAIPPDMRPRRHSYEVWHANLPDVAASIFGESKNVRRMPSVGELVRALNDKGVQQRMQISNVRVYAQDHGGTTVITFTRQPRISKKLLAAFPRLKPSTTT